MGNSERALELCAEILKVNPRLPRPRLIQSKLLMDQGQAMAAERNLFVLKTEYPSWPEAHLLYARAAITTGKKELARDAMRTVVKLVPTHAEQPLGQPVPPCTTWEREPLSSSSLRTGASRSWR